jgi:hypothetical protein
MFMSGWKGPVAVGTPRFCYIVDTRWSGMLINLSAIDAIASISSIFYRVIEALAP